MGSGFLALAREPSGFGLTWLVQSSFLLALGLLAGRVLRSWGPAVQSGVYRTTLAAVLICPVASAALSAAGFDGLSLELPSPALPAPAPSPQQGAIGARACVERSRRGPANRRGPLPPDADRLRPPPCRRNRESATARVNPGRAQLSIGPTEIAAVGLAVWLVGATFMAIRLCVGHSRIAGCGRRRFRRSRAPERSATTLRGG